MLQKVRSSLCETTSTRALAALIVSVSIEISTRRDTSSSHTDKAALKMLLTIHDALTYSWSKINPDCTPEEYIIAWDSFWESSSTLARHILVRRLVKSKLGIMSDLDSLLRATISENLLKAHAQKSVLLEISNREKTLAFA